MMALKSLFNNNMFLVHLSGHATRSHGLHICGLVDYWNVLVLQAMPNASLVTSLQSHASRTCYLYWLF